ncbi:MAG: hypothetical protein V2A58_14100 [Planctomycetota bacterium]
MKRKVMPWRILASPELIAERGDHEPAAAPAILTELCGRNMKLANIRAFVRIAREGGPFVGPSGCYVAARKAGEMR